MSEPVTLTSDQLVLLVETAERAGLQKAINYLNNSEFALIGWWLSSKSSEVLKNGVG